MGRYKHWDKTDLSMQDFMDVQLQRVKQRLNRWKARVRERRRDTAQPVLAEMEFERRQEIILHGGMGPRRPNLSQLDGDYE